MDAFITPEARREIDALMVFRPKPGTWGVLVGHTRGFRFIVEKAFPAGDGGSVPDERLLAGLDGVWPGRMIGLFTVRPGAAFTKAVRGPAWYGKLVLRLTGPARSPTMRAFVVEYKRNFVEEKVPLVPAAKEKARE